MEFCLQASEIYSFNRINAVYLAVQRMHIDEGKAANSQSLPINDDNDDDNEDNDDEEERDGD